MNTKEEKKHYRHILVAIDFVDDFEKVIDRAMQLRAEESRLSIMHCVDLISYPDNYAGGLAVQLQAQSIAHAEEVIARTIKNKGIQIEESDVIILPGTPGKEVRRYSDSEKVDLIVCGSHGKHGLQLLLGSASTNILHHAACDVLAVSLLNTQPEE